MTADADLLADLRQRAYGRGGAPLTAREWQQLARLELSRRPSGPQLDTAPLPPVAAEEDPLRVELPAADATTPVGRKRPMALMIAVVVLAILLPVAGWAGFLAAMAVQPAAAPRPIPTPMVAPGLGDALVDQSRERALAVEEWDSGLTLLSADERALVWWGEVGDQTCVVVDLVPDGPLGSCADTSAAKSTGIRLDASLIRVDDEYEVERESDVESSGPSVTLLAYPYDGRLMLRIDG